MLYLLTLSGGFLSTGVEVDIFLGIQWGSLCSLSADDAEWVSSSSKSLSEVDKEQADDEQSEQVKFVKQLI